MTREGKRCILYSRVSTEMQVDGYSLEGQVTCMKKFAEREEMKVIDIYEDAGKSGKSINGRPAFRRLLEDIKNDLAIDYVLVYKLSRFGRNAADILNSLEFIQSYGVELICVEEGIDSSQTSGKLLISVLSAVAEIERENIIEQTMNGRKEKARQGEWNGGPAPYGYRLQDNCLVIDEEEAETIRLIFDRFVNTDKGYGGVAKYLNLQGVKKNPHTPNSVEQWSAHYVKVILDNPVYCGKLAFGRRTREKVKGTKDEYRTVQTDDYILVDGKQEAIVDMETWERARKKRETTGVKAPSKRGRDRIHLLTGLLRCPKCGGLMYCNRHQWTKKDGTYKDVYYYYCGNSSYQRGHRCDYKAKLRKVDIEPLVIESIKELVKDEHFARDIQSRIGEQVDIAPITRELDNYKKKLKEVEANKTRLEAEIDSMPLDVKHRERKIQDMTARLDGLYDEMEKIEQEIEEVLIKKKSIEENALNLSSIYQILKTFGEIYDIIEDEEKKDLFSYLIKEIHIHPNDEDHEMPLKSIIFNFPIYKNGELKDCLSLDKKLNDETLVCLTRANHNV